MLCQLAVDNLLYAAKRRGLKIGIFWALHTFGRRLTWHPHVHVSVTLGVVNEHGNWKDLSFCHKKVQDGFVITVKLVSWVPGGCLESFLRNPRL